LQYDTIKLLKYRISALLDKLVATKNYPSSIRNFDFDKNLGIAVNSTVWDIEKGTILSLGENRVITDVLFGF
jgi:hypothetical protein